MLGKIKNRCREISQGPIRPIPPPLLLYPSGLPARAPQPCCACLDAGPALPSQKGHMKNWFLAAWALFCCRPNTHWECSHEAQTEHCSIKCAELSTAFEPQTHRTRDVGDVEGDPDVFEEPVRPLRSVVGVGNKLGGTPTRFTMAGEDE